MTSKKATLDFMIAHLETRVEWFVDKCAKLQVLLEAEKAIVKALQDHVNEIDDFEIAALAAKDNRVIN